MNTTTDNTSSSPIQTLPESYFATINGENYQDRHAREAREDFQRIKERAYKLQAEAIKLRAEAKSAEIEARIEVERVEAYELYLSDVYNTNNRFKTNYHPHPISSFGWEQCVLCYDEIRDDPFGHNAQPLAEGPCCSRCNKRVVEERFKKLRR